jgi:RHS repeat-associated protein
MDDKRRVALVETNTIDVDALPNTLPSTVTRHQLDNHLGSASLELDEGSQVISYEEYYPYGSTSYQAVRNDVEVSLKRYRYTGKERDEETGLYYHGARYYAPWLVRWTNSDPIGLEGGINSYAYVRGNPLRRIDPSGTRDQPVEPPKSNPILHLAPPGYRPPSPSERTTFQQEMDAPGRRPATNEAGFTPKQQEALAQQLVKDVGPGSPLDTFVNRVVPVAILLITALVSLPLLAGSGVAATTAAAARAVASVGVRTAAMHYGKIYAATSFAKGLAEDFPGQLGPDLPGPGDEAGQAARGAVKELIRDTGIASTVERKVAERGASQAHTIYFAYGEKGAENVTYIGITKNFTQRLVRQFARAGREINPIFPDLTREEARGVEQQLIELYRGEGVLTNKINSISPSSRDYPALMELGRQALHARGWPGF